MRYSVSLFGEKIIYENIIAKYPDMCENLVICLKLHDKQRLKKIKKWKSYM